MTKTQRGARAIIDSRDYVYRIHCLRKASKQISWQCCNRGLGCKAHITTLNGNIIKFRGDHDHPPPPQKAIIRF